VADGRLKLQEFAGEEIDSLILGFFEPAFGHFIHPMSDLANYVFT
jgi:hypothetical protein